MSNIKAIGKFLDQPLLISKLNKQMPKIMIAGASLLFAKNTYDSFKTNKDKNNARKETIKNGIILSSVIASSIMAPKIAGKITKRNPIKHVEAIKKINSDLIEDYIQKNKPKENIKTILTKAKEKILPINDIKKLLENLTTREDKKFFNKLIPSPENIKAKDIFSEIGYLSIYGAIPVLGGITGGISADIITKEKDYKKNIPNKLHEGLYQYLANIFMCNIGAGASLAILEKMNIKSKPARAIGMTTGIIATGVLGGSKIANLVSGKIINPILSPKEKLKERKPEALDMCLHTDDIATVSLLSGLKWIEPSLPILYSVSGYKAATGYRN